MHEPIPVTRSSMPSMDEYIKEIAPLWESRWLTNSGSLHQKLENALCSFLKAPFVSLHTNGHLALENAIKALDLEGEVITTPFTFASTTQAIVQNGLTPVFCDIKPDDYTMDPDKIEALITEKTCAILPVHVYGNLCDVDAINSIAQKHHLKVIYDAAHAFGVEKHGIGAGAFGDLSMFSFHATKVYNTIEGGAVICHDEEMWQKLAAIKNFGMTSPEQVPYVSGNAKMNEFQAAMGLCNLRHVEKEIEKRGKAVRKYRERLSDIPGIVLCFDKTGVKPNYAYFPVRIDPEQFGENRDALAVRLNQKNIFPRKYFYPLTSDFSCYRDRFVPADTPVARQAAENILTLPLYADLAEQDVDYICDAILEGKK